MILRHWHMYLAQRLFNRIHHHVRPTDEVLMVGIGRRQMTLEQVSGNEAPFTRPAIRWIRQHVDDRQIEPSLQSLQLLTEGNRFPILIAVEQGYGSRIMSVGRRTYHAHHGLDADPASDQHMHVCRIANGECAVWSIEIDAFPHGYLVNLAREVSQIPDRHLDAPVGNRGARGERERVPRDREGTSPHSQPGELARAEAETGVTVRLHHQRQGIAAFLAYFGNAV